MLQGRIDNIHIAGISAAVPKNVLYNENLPFEDIQKTIQSIGIKSRHAVNESQCTSDLCFHAAEKLLQAVDWDKDSIDCVIFISQTPDYFLPATAYVLQDRLQLTNASVVFDINLGCSGYVYPLCQGQWYKIQVN